METLKLTPLAVFVLFGLLLSGNAVAYPETFNQIDGTEIACDERQISSPEVEEHNDNLNALSQFFVNPIEAINTPPLDHDREAHAQTCRLDLDLIEMD